MVIPKRRCACWPVATAVLVIALLGSLWFASSSQAHAVLQETSPSRGVTVKRQPEQVVFRFNEPVESSFGAVRVYDANGKRVDAGNVLRPGGDKTVGVKLEPNLPRGTYTATFRVISADAHPVSGGFVFSIGAAGAVGKSVSELTAESDVGTVTDVAFGIARGVTYASIALAIGCLIFLLAVWLPGLRSVAGHEQEWVTASEGFARQLRILMIVALSAGLVSELLQIVLQGATAAGITFWSALDPDVIREVLKTRFGTVHLIAASVFGSALILFSARGWVPSLRAVTVGAAGLSPPRRMDLAQLALVGALFGFLALSPALSGHASSQSPSALLIPLDFMHVVAMSVWIGGLVTLVLVLPSATRAFTTPDRTRLLVAALIRFSPLALASVCVLLATGLVQSFVHIRSFDNLIHTGYGRAVLVKFCMLLGLIALGAHNRNLALPRLKQLAEEGRSPGIPGMALRRALRGEIALLAMVLGVTALLVSYAPANTPSTGPFAATKVVGPIEMQVTVDPASVGRNEMHLYMFLAKDGSQFNETKEMRIRMSLPSKDVGPIAVKATKAGPGHYVVPAADFTIAGKWDVTFAARVSEFDQYETKVEVPID
jgi:copper transport protein